MLNLLTQFLYLQLLDVLTTLAFLLNGVRESNPVIAFLIQLAGTPLAGLLAAKVAALGLAVYCWRASRHKLLMRANAFYAVLVAWNLVALILGAARVA